MKGDGKCVQCAAPYEERDVVPILPSTDKDKAFVVERMIALKALGLSHSLKKASGSKKRKANGSKDAEPAAEISGVRDVKADGKNKGSTSDARTDVPRSTSAVAKPVNGLQNAATASLTARVLEEEEARKRRKRDNENINSLYTKKGDEKSRKNTDFMTRGFSIPANARHQ
jgi:hypothetical protein